MPVLVAVLAAGAGIFAYASLIERRWYALRRHVVPCLPAGAAPIRVLHVSDLHLRAGQRGKRRWLRGLARLEPDLVVGTGDFLGDDSPQTLAATLETLDALPGRSGRVYVLGSNDYFGPMPKNPLRYLRRRRARPHSQGPQNPWRELVAGLAERGWVDLRNRTARLDVVKAAGRDAPSHTARLDVVEVVGQDDAHIARDDPSAIPPRPAGAAGTLRLGVAHSPDSAPALAAAGAALVLCGHTHGGQVCLPGVGALVTNCSLPRAMASGLHRFEGTWLHVSAGLGTSMYAPYRLACRPEACLLELVQRAG